MQCILYLYADDLSILVDDKQGAQKASRLLKRWCDQNLVVVNYKKCGIMEIKRNKQEEISSQETGELWNKFPKVNNYKYLGLNLNQSLQPKEYIAYS